MHRQQQQHLWQIRLTSISRGNKNILRKRSTYACCALLNRGLFFSTLERAKPRFSPARPLTLLAGRGSWQEILVLKADELNFEKFVFLSFFLTTFVLNFSTLPLTEVVAADWLQLFHLQKPSVCFLKCLFSKYYGSLSPHSCISKHATN